MSFNAREISAYSISSPPDMAAEPQQQHGYSAYPLSARTHQPSFHSQLVPIDSFSACLALSTTPEAHNCTRTARDSCILGSGVRRGPFELLTCELTETHPRSMAQRPPASMQ